MIIRNEHLCLDSYLKNASQLKIGMRSYSQYLDAQLAKAIDPNMDTGGVMINVQRVVNNEITNHNVYVESNIIKQLYSQGIENLTIDSGGISFNADEIYDGYAQYIDSMSGQVAYYKAMSELNFNATIANLKEKLNSFGNNASEWIEDLLSSASDTTNAFQFMASYIKAEVEKTQASRIQSGDLSGVYTDKSGLALALTGWFETAAEFFDKLDFRLTKLADTMAKIGLAIMDALQSFVGMIFPDVFKHFELNDSFLIEALDIPIAIGKIKPYELSVDSPMRVQLDWGYCKTLDTEDVYTYHVLGPTIDNQVTWLALIQEIRDSITNSGSLLFFDGGYFIVVSYDDYAENIQDQYFTVAVYKAPVSYTAKNGNDAYVTLDIVSSEKVLEFKPSPYYNMNINLPTSNENFEVAKWFKACCSGNAVDQLSDWHDNFKYNDFSSLKIYEDNSYGYYPNDITLNYNQDPTIKEMDFKPSVIYNMINNDLFNNNDTQLINKFLMGKFIIAATLSVLTDISDDTIPGTVIVKENGVEYDSSQITLNNWFIPYLHIDEFKSVLHAQTDSERSSEVSKILVSCIVALAIAGAAVATVKLKKKLKVNQLLKKVNRDNAYRDLRIDPSNHELVKNYLKADRAYNFSNFVSSLVLGKTETIAGKMKNKAIDGGPTTNYSALSGEIITVKTLINPEF